MDLDQLPVPDKMVAGTGTVLIVDLVFLPWHSVDLGVVAWTRTAIESPNRLWGALAVLLTIAVVAVTVVQAFRPGARVAELPVASDRAVLLAAAGVLGLLVLKLVLDTDALGIGAWLGLGLAAGMASGAHRRIAASSRPDVAE